VTELEDAPASPSTTFTSFGNWDAGGSWSFSHADHWLERFDSHFLPAWNRTGSNIRMHMWNNDGRDRFHGHRNNGYLVEYRLPTTKQVTIELDVTCAFSEHELYGDDEWGESDCHGAAIETGLFETYSGWDYYTPTARTTRGACQSEPWISSDYPTGIRSRLVRAGSSELAPT